MNGSDGSVTFTDEMGHTFTANGNAEIDTAQYKFATASGLFGGSVGDYIYSIDSDDWDLADSDFTIDFWVRWNSDVNSIFISQDDASSDRAWQVYYLTSNTLNFWYTTDGTTATRTIISETWNPSTATWYHVAIVRASNFLYMFINGTQLGTEDAISATIWNGSENIQIGEDSGALTMNGWFDEVRIVKGTGIWTSNFTSPSAAYVACSTGRRRIMILD